MLGLESISKTNPLLSYFFMGQIILFCTALLVGALLLLKRLVKKQPFEGDPAFDNERIATEIHQEILKLQDLRNRLNPSLAASDVAVASAPAAEAGAAPAVAGEAVDRAAVENEVSTKFEATIQGLEAELKTLKEQAAGAAAAPATAGAVPEGYLSPDQVKAEIAKAAESGSGELKKKAEEATQQVVHLEKVLSEYRIFEEDFALVKKYKAENEALQRQLASMEQAISGAPAETPAVAPEAPLAAPVAEAAPAAAPAVDATPVSDQIDQLFAADAKVPEEKIVIAADAPAPVEKTVIAATPETKQPSDQDLSSLFDEIKKKPEEVAATPAASAPVEAAPAPAVEAAPAPAPAVEAAPPAAPSTVDEGLAKALDEKGSEAAAESMGSDDNLMAEFEKLLSNGDAKN